VRIFTGGPLPDGADAVAIQENARVGDGVVRFAGAVAPGTFVRPAGLDFARGWVGLTAGTPLDARALGLAAAMGHVWLPVRPPAQGRRAVDGRRAVPAGRAAGA
jgi:molybdopterin molybdotransferase